MSATVCVIWSSVGRSSGATPTGRITSSISGWYLITPRFLISLGPPADEFLRTHWGEKRVIVSESAGLLNEQNALEQRAQNCFSVINSWLSDIALIYSPLKIKADSYHCLFFPSLPFFYIAVTEKGKRTHVSFSYHPRARSNKWTAVAPQFRCGESLVNIFDGVSTDHCSAPEQRQREERRVISLTKAGKWTCRDTDQTF